MGYRVNGTGNAVEAAQKPTFDFLQSQYPWTLIEASGPWVGLPPGQMGNSEVGHLNIGSGRVIQMDVTRIDTSILEGKLFTNPVLLEAMHTKRLHFFGLLSDGGVHSMNTHLYALLEMAKRQSVEEVFVHVFTDGRDTPPNSGAGFVAELEAKMRELGVGKIASVSGRYYAMDRDQRWERVAKAYTAIVLGTGDHAPSATAAIEAAYAKGVTDEFIEPVTILDEGLVQDGDSIIFYNYRADRARELTQMVLDPVVAKAGGVPQRLRLRYTQMTEYDKSYGLPYAFGPLTHTGLLADALAAHGKTNLRVAETEKYPHVTYFFNGGNENIPGGESRKMVKSPKVATYDLQPEMSAPEVCDVVVHAITEGDYDVIVVNFANPDMVGHTGVFAAAVEAVETCDACLKRIWEVLQTHPAIWMITADHGNSETMIDPETGLVHTYHTTNPVPFILVDPAKPKLREGGSLRDIAPTILGVLGVPQPTEMTGRDLRA
ncbi:MAG: 2,3-bisphosphoglycerate-independent phosphoglycerate mutase [Bryobacteraceae bacterium]|nr:2,3-bisphosphoglycerate-independent phosphoglycerate mutase [Bryobacteraceae bacterium]